MFKMVQAVRVFTILILFVAPARAATEEFVGPFPSWADVKRDYGAIGDGKADDTAAIQKGLDDLREHKKFCVLYFPAGIYRVTATVHTERKAHTNCMCSVVGADPATTILRWDGAEGGTLFQYDAWYAKISRLTLDGAGRAKICLAYGEHFSTYNETSDMVFKDAEVGMFMRPKGFGQAENAILRCRFLRCSNAGLYTNGFNCYDLWVWHCRFEDCGYGLFNRAGNFHAYRSLFLRSKEADVAIVNLMVFALVENTSVGSKAFMRWSGYTWGSPTSVTGNRILEPTGDPAIHLDNGGPFLVMDNVIKSRPDQTKPAVQMTRGDQVFIGNTYTIANAVAPKGRHRVLDEKVVDPKTIDSQLPELPGTPQNLQRPVFEVSAGADAEGIQKVLDTAAKRVGERPVVHLPMGIYKIKRTLIVPGLGDVQLVGDGASEIATVLQWVGPPGEPLLRLQGPTRATVRDLNIAAGAGTGILIEDSDQDGAKVFADQLKASGSSPNTKAVVGVHVDGVERADVLLRNCQGGTHMERWVHVTGGARRRTGEEAPGQVSVFCGATGTSDSPYTVDKGGRLVVRTVYHEVSGDSAQALLLNDAGTLIIDSTRFSYKTAPDRPLIGFDGFRGSFALTTCLLRPVDSPHPASFRFRGRGDECHALCLANLFWAPEGLVKTEDVWKNEARPPANAALLLCNMNTNAKKQVPEGTDIAKQPSGFGRLEDQSRKDDDALIRQTLAPMRQARIWLPGDTRPGVTDCRLYRVAVGAGKNGRCVVLRAGK